MKHLWGREVAPEELMRLGERIWNLGRLFNLREGFTAADDVLPSRVHEQAFAEGPAAGNVITREEFAASLAEYYRLRGWDENGVPTEEKLQELEIDVRL
jgi:aldehyde:ferredoxin oxidoreductase